VQFSQWYRTHLSYTMKKPIFLFLLLILCATSFAQAGRRVDKIIAVVNDEVITQSDVDRVLVAMEAEYKAVYSDSQQLSQRVKQAEKNIINQMVEEKLILCEAKNFDIKIDEDKIEARIEEIKKDFDSAQEFEWALELQGLTLQQLRDRFINQEIMKNMVEYFVKSKVRVDPAQIKQFYQTHQKELAQPQRALVKIILITADGPGRSEKGQDGEYPALQTAKTLLERLKQGESFEDLAKNYSQGATASDGGSMGFIEKGQLIEELDRAIFSLRPGEFTDVLKINQGYGIFKVDKRQPERPVSFAQARDSIKDILYNKQFTEAFKKWLDELKEKAYISIKENLTEVESRE
jgi:peptidyl-prolyl cis-trans isomerase SurA